MTQKKQKDLEHFRKFLEVKIKNRRDHVPYLEALINGTNPASDEPAKWAKEELAVIQVTITELQAALDYMDDFLTCPGDC